MYKAVIFDMGGVLVPMPGIWRDYEKDAGLEPKSIIRALLHIGIRETFCATEKGELTLEDLESQFADHCRKLYSKPDLPQWPLFSRTRHLAGRSDLMISKMEDVIKKIRAKGLKTALLTNNFWFDSERKQAAMYVNQQLFDVTVESCKLGMRKPEKPIYEFTLEKLGCTADEAIFLDDLAWNIKAGAEIGMKCIHVKDPSEAADELAALLAV